MTPPRTRGAKPAPPRPSEPKAANLKPLRIEAVLIAARTNDEGEVVGEVDVGRIKLFAPEFATLPKVVTDLWPQVLAEHAPEPAKPKRRKAKPRAKGTRSRKRA